MRLALLSPQAVTCVNAPRTTDHGNAISRLNLNGWLQLFLTIIAGAAVAVIVWAVVQRFLHIIALLIASFLVAYVLSPLVDRLEHGLRRSLSILLVYLAIFVVVAIGFVLLLGPLTIQLRGLIDNLPGLISPKGGTQTRLDQFFAQHGISLTVADLRTQVASWVSSIGGSLLSSTLTIVTGVVQVITDLLLVLAITFYLLLDGRTMHTRAVRLLPVSFRERWFFFEATIDKVLGGYIRGQLIVAVTVGVAAGAGCAVLGVRYFLVIGLLAALFELIPMIGPVLGAVPAVFIALFQSPTLVVWVVVYFIVIQQIESNVIVPRVSGHAVGLHPLAALLALLVGLELGGLGGALLSVPLAGVLWVMVMALYGDVTGQARVLAVPSRRAGYVSRAWQMVDRRRGKPGEMEPDGGGASQAPAHNERLATIRQEQEHLLEQFEAEQAVADNAAQAEPEPDVVQGAGAGPRPGDA